VSQDRLEEKSFLNALGLATTPFERIDGPVGIPPALNRLGSPALLKSRRDGYDGKGQAWVSGAGESEAVFASIGSRPAILEARAAFVRELSVIAARSWSGEVAAYPVGENRHANGVLRTSVAPAAIATGLQAEALRIAATLLEALNYVGVIGVELFELSDGRLLVNEFAPRVHNTGHWTLARVEMSNLLGDEANDWAALAADPRARLWLYGKRDIAPGRKMGHVNRLSPLA
jgi:5-(carboxyamino)imidazole ribonucleotide synthase